jgi:predicted nuclease with TOPRIM domain
MDELEAVREELLNARAEAERLAEEAAEREARQQELTAELETVRQELAAARDAARDLHEQTVARYRALILQAAPDVPANLIRGETFDDLDRSLAEARQTVTAIHEQARGERAARVPAGSPVRGAGDWEGLTPAEKIRAGIRQY